jgi:kinesin family protein 15
MDAECTSKHNNNDNVKVYVRVRPPNSHEISAQSKNCVFVRENNTVILDAKPPKVFTFDYVADAHVTQEEIFERVGKPIAESCIAGYHGTIFAYGQTGSGKTYTIQGALTESGEDIWELRGLIPRVLECLFTHISKHRQTSSNVEYLCTCSYLEIYNEQITDLLNPHGGKLRIHNFSL